MRNSGESFNSGEQDRSNNPNRNRGNMSYRATLEQTQENLSRRERLSRMSDEELRKLQRELMAKKEQEEKARMERGTPTEAPVPQETPVETPVPQEAPTESSETEEASPETISEEEAKKTKERAEKKPAVKSLFNKATAMLIAGSIFVGAVAGAAGAGVFDAKREALKDNQPKVEETYDKTEKQEQKEKEKQFDNLTGIEVLDEKIDGSFEQDDNLGCFEDKNKVSQNAVGNPDAVLKEMGVDPATATAEQRGKASEYATYSMKYPTAFQSIAYGIEGFENLSLNEAEDKISKMSDGEKANLQEQIHKFHENSKYSEEVGQGVYRNHGVAEREDGSRHSYFVESDLTGKNILVRETKRADGTTVVTREKEDCFNMLTEIEYRQPDGSSIVVKINNPNEPTPPKHEWGKSGDPHSGPNRRPSDQVDPNSRVSKKQNDNTNKGNEGNASTRPGSPSGANNNQRLSGGTNQSGGGTAGTNSAPKGNPEADAKGNNNQKKAQEKNQVGGNNNSDSAEESKVAEGDF